MKIYSDLREFVAFGLLILFFCGGFICMAIEKQYIILVLAAIVFFFLIILVYKSLRYHYKLNEGQIKLYKGKENVVISYETERIKKISISRFSIDIAFYRENEQRLSKENKDDEEDSDDDLDDEWEEEEDVPIHMDKTQKELSKLSYHKYSIHLHCLIGFKRYYLPFVLELVRYTDAEVELSKGCAYLKDTIQNIRSK